MRSLLQTVVKWREKGKGMGMRSKTDSFTKFKSKLNKMLAPKDACGCSADGAESGGKGNSILGAPFKLVPQYRFSAGGDVSPNNRRRGIFNSSQIKNQCGKMSFK